jgi:hypothetical protein
MDDATRARCDRMQHDLNVIEADLAALDKQPTPPPSATQLFFEKGGYGSGRSPYDMSPDPNWPRLA